MRPARENRSIGSRSCWGAQSANIWILGDSATRIKHQGRYVYQSLLDNALGLAIIRWLARLPGEHIVIACAAIREEVPDHLKALVRRSYTQLQTVAESPRTL
ncbi:MULTISPECIES: hypothetical protein [Aeromonas]|uniref:Uncharacterized protein n=1 Tax=Aeromonas caviae TaxID=648 RepID=A0AAW9F0N4_AERCA|nr:MULTISPECIES: hypothetical protein [Aeromonas]MCR3939533.1 hypothetical protein [Aeromonas caviae]MCR3948370.1 hypothetical protein [Aeromonas caviae]MDX7721737.1 hypothetical protein [Aeromonas caviae]QWZ53804.1 hypothetical protein I6L32_18695 [Aeromonas sp. FDAARGOS 1402]